jgi:hypothetical protein
MRYVSSMPRPKSDVVQVAFRIARKEVARATALVPKLTIPGINVTRTDVLRAAIAEGLRVLEGRK